MSDELKLQESVKRTQDLLGKYIKKPPLTEKLLKKPPFRFLHDIISAVIKETGFLKNLFTEEESNSANIKDKEAKLTYLTKLIDAVKLITGNELSARPSKIIAGQEPIKTNELLQAIGRALDKKVSSSEAIEFYKKNSEKKENLIKKSKTNLAVDDKTKKTGVVKKSSSSEKPSTREKTKDEKPKRESKVLSRDTKIRADSTERKDSRVTTRESRKREANEAPKKRKTQASSEKRAEAQEKVTNSASIQPEEVKIEQSAALEGLKEANGVPEEDPVAANPENKEEVIKEITKDDDKVVMSPKKGEPSPEPIEQKPLEAATLKIGGLLRPPSARPPSARPAAPRIRGKPDFVINNIALTQMGDVNVIVENFDTKEDDAEEMVIVQTASTEDTSLTGGSDLLNSQLTQEHGYLVAQILETQRELVNEGNVELIPNKVEIEWETGIKKDRDAVVKEVDKLRGTIQSLTRTTNPLGKLLDFLQEDAEIMEKELQDWRNQFNDIRDQLIIERNTTKDSLKPLEESLKEVESTIVNQMEKIFQTKSNIMKNNQKIQKLLSGR